MSDRANCFLVKGLYVLRWASSTCLPYFFSRALITSPRSMTCSSKALARPRNMWMSCPDWAATSAVARGTTSAKLTWSTGPSTPLAAPQALAHGSNHLSYAGTKWLHWRILSCPAASARRVKAVDPSAVAAVPAATSLAPLTMNWRRVFMAFLPDEVWHRAEDPAREEGITVANLDAPLARRVESVDRSLPIPFPHGGTRVCA